MNHIFKDTRGNPSITLTICVLTWVAVTVKFFMGDLTGMEYAAVVGTAMAGWVGREYTEKVKK